MLPNVAQSICLPSISTLMVCMWRVDIKPRFHPAVLEGLCYVFVIRHTATPSSSQLAFLEHCMTAETKICAIVFDEMAIKEHLCYDAGQDCVEGLEDLGNAGRYRYVANHAGVFMVHGLVQKWKQPVGYFITTGPMIPYLL